MGQRVLQLLRNEPTAVGTLVASVTPLLVLAGVVDLDEHGVAPIVVAVNALVGFGVCLAVTPTEKVYPGLAANPQTPAR